MTGNRVFLVVVLLLSMGLTGCWDSTEPERMLYIHGIGVDYRDEQYEVYTQIIDFVNTAKSDQPSREKVQAEVGRATGKTMDEAFFKLYHSIDQKVFWGHFSYLILSEEVLKQGKVNPIIDSFIRYRETRYQIWVYTTKDSVEDVLLITPTLNKAITLSKLGDPMNSFKQESYIEPINFRKLIIGLNEPSHEVSIPYVSIKKNWETVEGSDEASSLKGVGIITPNQFKGFIEGDKARGMQWMSKETLRGEITAKFEGDEENYVTVVVDKVKQSVEPVVNDGEVVFDILVTANVIISLIQGDVPYDEMKKGIEKQIEKEILDTYKEALEKDIDIYRLSEKLYRSNLKEWKKRENKGKIELSEESIDVKVEVQKVDGGRKTLTETVER